MSGAERASAAGDGRARLEVVPRKGQFRPGERLVFDVRGDGGFAPGGVVRWRVCELERTAAEGRCVWAEAESADTDAEASLWRVTAEVSLEPLGAASGAYGLVVEAEDRDGETRAAETAFDVAAHWREAPRYGFLSDFAPEEAGRLADAAFLGRRHISLVQFYDWMYRHDRLLPDEDEFVDPLGRRMSLAVVREKIAALRERGIASMAYVAVYGSLPDYAQAHPDQVLYRNDGRPHSLGGFFHIMDISEDSAWTAHIVAEMERAVETMGFDGVQLDQYGFPKKAIRRRADGRADVVTLKELYPRFIDRTRERLGEDVGIVYNNVSNFPTHTTAQARLDAMYIEVWDPESRLRDLKRIISDARRWSGKQVVLAAYFPAFLSESAPAEQAETGARLAMAAIFASGGYHISLGEEGKLLADPYFPKYGTISGRFADVVQRYYDFIVLYRDLLFDLALDDVSMAYTGGINTEVVFARDGVTLQPNGDAGTVWTFVKEKPGFLVLQTVNLNGIEDDAWKKAKKQPPEPVTEVEIRVETWEAIESVHWATPDGGSILPRALPFDYVPKGGGDGWQARFVLPRVDYWSLVYVKLRDGVPAETFGGGA